MSGNDRRIFQDRSVGEATAPSRVVNLWWQADLIPDRRCATPSCSSGGLISKSCVPTASSKHSRMLVAPIRYIEKPAWVNLTNGHHHGVPKHRGLHTPPPDHYQQDVAEFARKQLLTKYLPTKNTPTISQFSGKSEIEWLEYYAAQVHHVRFSERAISLRSVW